MTSYAPMTPPMMTKTFYLAIQASTACYPQLSFQFLHILEHQDAKPDHPLMIEEQHNVECDALAKHIIQTHHLCSMTLDNLDFEAASPHLYINGWLICQHFLPALRQAAAAPAYFKYLSKRLNWTHANTHMVQWRTLELALHSFPRNNQCRIVLLIHDKLPLRHSKFHLHLGSILCPLCKRNPEDHWHF